MESGTSAEVLLRKSQNLRCSALLSRLNSAIVSITAYLTKSRFMLSSRHQFLLALALLASGLVRVAGAQQSIGELYATDASVKGSVILAGSGTSVLSGSAIQAGGQAATLKLDRGGSLLVCPGTNLSVTASQNGRALLYSVNSGNIELDYPIGASADTLLTPDFRLLLPGPGVVHVAVRVTPTGDTCVQSLPSNGTALVVSETMGDGTYQVKSDEAVLFRGGHISDTVHVQENCGCRVPKPEAATRFAKAPPPPPPEEAKPAPAPVASTPPPPTEHVAVEAPFVFHGDDPYPDLTPMVASLRLESKGVVQMETMVLPPPDGGKSQPASQAEITDKQQKKRGFFASVGAFFASIFH
jgi:hypothetical protein